MRCFKLALRAAAPLLVLAGPATAAPCDADLDRDGIVGSGDLNIILAAFGNNASGDVDGNGVTNSTDLNVLLAGFGISGCSTGTGSCCAANGTPGCDDAACASAVCGFDAACCEVLWDSTCVKFAGEFCSTLCPPVVFGGDCCAPNGTPGCDDEACTGSICSADPFCCEAAWDEPCAVAAVTACDACRPASGKPDCCETHKYAGCEDEECEELVCLLDVYCCDEEWDDVCSNYAVVFCWICD